MTRVLPIPDGPAMSTEVRTLTGWLSMVFEKYRSLIWSRTSQAFRWDGVRTVGRVFWCTRAW